MDDEEESFEGLIGCRLRKSSSMGKERHARPRRATRDSAISSRGGGGLDTSLCCTTIAKISMRYQFIQHIYSSADIWTLSASMLESASKSATDMATLIREVLFQCTYSPC